MAEEENVSYMEGRKLERPREYICLLQKVNLVWS